MKEWGYGLNTFHKTAHVYVEEMPWHLHCLQEICEWFCCHFPNIPFPSWLHYTYTNEDGSKEVYTWKEWWGGTNAWFHMYIHSPIFDLAYNKGKCKGYCLSVDYEALKDIIKEIDKEYYDRIIKSEKEDEQDKERESRESNK